MRWTSCPLTVPGNRRFLPVMVYPERAEVHILDDEAASRAYIEQVWAEAMTTYKSGDFKLSFTPEMIQYLKEHQRDFMPEDTKAGMIQAYLDRYTGSAVCSKQLFREALNHPFDEPKQWEIREVNDIMNHGITGWKYFSNPRIFEGYGRQKGWERETPATGADNRREKNAGRICGSHGADGASLLKKSGENTAGCRPPLLSRCRAGCQKKSP